MSSPQVLNPPIPGVRSEARSSQGPSQPRGMETLAQSQALTPYLMHRTTCTQHPTPSLFPPVSSPPVFLLPPTSLPPFSCLPSLSHFNCSLLPSFHCLFPPSFFLHPFIAFLLSVPSLSFLPSLPPSSLLQRLVEPHCVPAPLQRRMSVWGRGTGVSRLEPGRSKVVFYSQSGN